MCPISASNTSNPPLIAVLTLTYDKVSQITVSFTDKLNIHIVKSAKIPPALLTVTKLYEHTHSKASQITVSFTDELNIHIAKPARLPLALLTN